MCKNFVLRGTWLSTFSRDAMRILYLSLARHWWHVEWETGELIVLVHQMCSSMLDCVDF